MGFQEISLDENGYLFATWPANTDKPVPTIGFIAHMDTSPDMTGAGVTPRIVYGYDGTDIVLCEEDNIILSPKQFPELLDHKGEDLIVTNVYSHLPHSFVHAAATHFPRPEKLPRTNHPG